MDGVPNISAFAMVSTNPMNASLEYGRLRTKR